MRYKVKVNRVYDLQEIVSEEEWLILDVLRSIIRSKLPDYCKEKISYNVPYFYGKKGICIVWPASIPRGGIKSGVLLGFWRGNELKDVAGYLDHGTNKKIYYKIFDSVDEINVPAIELLLDEAIELDAGF